MCGKFHLTVRDTSHNGPPLDIVLGCPCRAGTEVASADHIARIRDTVRRGKHPPHSGNRLRRRIVKSTHTKLSSIMQHAHSLLWNGILRRHFTALPLFLPSHRCDVTSSPGYHDP